MEKNILEEIYEGLKGKDYEDLSIMAKTQGVRLEKAIMKVFLNKRSQCSQAANSAFDEMRIDLIKVIMTEKDKIDNDNFDGGYERSFHNQIVKRHSKDLEIAIHDPFVVGEIDSADND